MKLSMNPFGTDKDDLRIIINKIAAILRVVTINIDKNYTKRISPFSYVLVILTIICYVYAYVISLLWFLFVRTRETRDYTAVSIAVALTGCSATCTTKFLFMVFYKDAVQGIVQRYLECDSKLVPGSRFAENFLKRFHNVKKRALTFWLTFVILDILYILRPLVTPGRHLPEDSYVLYGLEPMVVTPNYQIALTVLAFATFPAVYVTTGVITLILTIIGYTESQMLALSDELLNLWADAEKYYEENKETVDAVQPKVKIVNGYINNRLKEIIVFHITNINLFYDFENIFRMTMAVEFSLLIVAIVATLLGGIENTFMELYYCFFQIFINCLIGQKLIDACVVFENAVYDCKWENFDKTNRKFVLLMLQIAQRLLVLTAGGLAPLNFICLMSVIKSTYSAYTTLQSNVN